MATNIADIRKDYIQHSLDEDDVHENAVEQFHLWFNEAIKAEVEEVNAMTLATADADGAPSARIVLLKGADEKGFSFFTNYNSKKGRDLEANPRAALVFFWKELERQVRVTGTVSKLSKEESDEYFFSRPEGSRIGAWSSPQSEVIASREILNIRVSEKEKGFSGKIIERPDFWGGYVVKPVKVEFWQGRESRLHDRLLYTLEGGKWKISRLAP
ncbi:MAG: pyridoxamine 5'-phosphate oxidase [Chitinophagaceae bacterium]|nr:MAG: pyridoxamine 5'-phosphate oxidase [Chitinophagaceae bacterium]